MRSGVLALVILAALLPLASGEDVSDPAKVNRILTSFETPTLEPGGAGSLSFTLHNPYRGAISSVNLTAGIYRFATVEANRFVDEAWPWCEPFIREAGTACSKEVTYSVAELAPGQATRLTFDVVTSIQMPHGNPLSESAYFVRFLLTFDLSDDGIQRSYVMASRGHFSEAAWLRATAYTFSNPCTDPSCRGNVNLAILGVDGILPDSSFAVKAPIPLWPFWALAAGFGVSSLLTLFYYAEAHPGRLPRIERSWLAFKAKVGRLFQRGQGPRDTE